MLRKIFPHVTIVLCNMYIVFYCIDRVNSAMSFIDNSITKALLLILCLLSIVNAIFLIRDERRKVARGNRRRPAGIPQTRAAGARPYPGTPASRPYPGTSASRPADPPRRSSRFG